jgi:hypothetical protein
MQQFFDKRTEHGGYFEVIDEHTMMPERQTYWQTNLHLVIRRCELELWKLFQACCNNNLQAVEQMQHSTGEPVIMMPSTRAMLVQRDKVIESKLPKLHLDLVEFYKLTMPMNRDCMPTTVAELKDLNFLPEHCMYKTLDEDSAKLVFENLKQK